MAMVDTSMLRYRQLRIREEVPPLPSHGTVAGSH